MSNSAIAVDAVVVVDCSRIVLAALGLSSSLARASDHFDS
jgi:hypothetical protein